MRRLIDCSFFATLVLASLLATSCDRTVYESPLSANYSFTIEENSANNSIVGDASVTDPNRLPLSYSIEEGDSVKAFSIDPSSGIIRVANSLLIDYEQYPNFHLVIRVSNGKSTDAFITADIEIINLIDTRFLEAVFDQIDHSTGIYGNLPDFHTMDIYTPHNDTIDKRPLVILAPGGNFDPNQIDYSHGMLIPLAQKLAHAGYLAVVINYRTGETNSETKYKTAFFNALHDLKAAVRYFRKDLYTDNKFFIDENKIFTGGWSAGAQIGLYNAYVNSEDELNADEKDELKAYGGFEGDSGNPGYSSQVSGMISMAGNIADLSDIMPGDPIIMCIHGSNDAIINIDSQARFFGTVYGSRPIIARAQEVGLVNKFIEIPDGEHTTPIKPACPTCFDEIISFLWSSSLP